VFILCVGTGFATGWSTVRGFYRLCIGSRNWKSGQGPTKGCRAIITIIIIMIIIIIPLNCLVSSDFPIIIFMYVSFLTFMPNEMEPHVDLKQNERNLCSPAL
jgi:hypothetical protein